MDFITSLLKKSRRHDSIMIVMDKLTKVAHFIRVKSTYSASDVAKVFLRDVVRVSGVSKNIVLEKDVKFTFNFYKELFGGFRT